MSNNCIIHTSTFPPLSIPEDISFTEFLFSVSLSRFRNKNAFIDAPTSRALTYGQVHESIYKVAAALHARGFQQGQVFCIFSPNVLEYCIIFNAVIVLGKEKIYKI